MDNNPTIEWHEDRLSKMEGVCKSLKEKLDLQAQLFSEFETYVGMYRDQIEISKKNGVSFPATTIREAHTEVFK